MVVSLNNKNHKIIKKKRCDWHSVVVVVDDDDVVVCLFT